MYACCLQFLRTIRQYLQHQIQHDDLHKREVNNLITHLALDPFYKNKYEKKIREDVRNDITTIVIPTLLELIPIGEVCVTKARNFKKF